MLVALVMWMLMVWVSVSSFEDMMSSHEDTNFLRCFLTDLMCVGDKYCTHMCLSASGLHSDVIFSSEC